MITEEKNTIINIEDEMKTSYINYAMSVIVGRALPDIRDGLKPVHRRILYAMFREGLLSNKKHSKSAGVVGEVIKKYHPHGDTAIYDALVRMVQDFNMRYPLVDGQGNFGSIDGDPPAAYRYTEARLTKIAEEMLADIDKETVDFAPNFDETTEEPLVLPSKTPNLLINGSSGIAVGMATNIPPHNLSEIIDGLIMLLDNPKAAISDLMKVVKGPDFPTAGFIHGTGGIKDAFNTGRGSIQMRARAIVEINPKNDKESIIVTELPYQVNKARLIERIAELVRDKKIEGITDLRDESDKEGMRIVIELKKGAIAGVVLNQLYKHTSMQSTFGVIMLALVNNQPRVLNLKESLHYFVEHRKEVVIRRTRFDLRKAEERRHILEGLKIALDNLDAVIALIRKSKTPEEARTGLMEKFKLTQIQAQAILDMKLQKLTGLEREGIINEYEEILKIIEYLKSVLADEKLVKKLVKEELSEIKEKYGDERRTEIVPETKEITLEDMIASEEMVITISHSGYIKRNPLKLYRSQRRGGKGMIGMETKEEDFVEHLFVASTHDYLLFFTNNGKVYWLKVYEVPEAGKQAKGKAIINLLQLSTDEKLTTVLPVSKFEEGRYVVMCTKMGVIKKTSLSAFSNPRAGGIIAVSIDKGDSLVAAGLTDGKKEILIGTKKGLGIRFNEDDVRDMGRTARGVRGIDLQKGNEVVGMEIVKDNSTIMTIAENGFGKRTELDEYRLQSRGGKGIITIKTTERNGDVVGILQVSDDDEIMMITAHGKVIRLKLKSIRTIGRNTQGVRLFDLDKEDKIKDVALLAEKEEEEPDEKG
ncbi:MAG: DNA gyrase subunit A [Nitrospirota bacterium]